jgi:hypothetical protein
MKAEHLATIPTPFEGLEKHSKIGVERKKTLNEKLDNLELESMKPEVFNPVCTKSVIASPKSTKGVKLKLEHQKMKIEALDLISEVMTDVDKESAVSKRMAGS